MMSLNPFVDMNKVRINQFLNDLCEVGDFYDTLEVSYIFPRIIGRHTIEIDNISKIAGPVYGVVKEGPFDQHHAE